MYAHMVLVSSSTNPSHDKLCATRKRDSVTICQRNINVLHIFPCVILFMLFIEGVRINVVWQKINVENKYSSTVQKKKNHQLILHQTFPFSLNERWWMIILLFIDWACCHIIYPCWLQVKGTGFYRRPECTTCMWLVRPFFISLML